MDSHAELRRLEWSRHFPMMLPTILRRRSLLIVAFLGAMTCAFPECVLAGVGPENTLVVVNARSWSSRTVANHYTYLRRIPAVNVVYLDWKGSDVSTDIATFRRDLLQPVINTIKKRGLKDQIDCITWSAGFPYEIDFSQEVGKDVNFPSGSITGLTYLYEMVLRGESEKLTARRTNRYAKTLPVPSATRGFRHEYDWKSTTPSDAGQHYYLSTLLGYATGRGNSIDDIVKYLRRSALADGQNPDGTVYFMTNADVRTKTRSGHFNRVAKAIRVEGGKVEIVEGNAPLGKNDVIGAMTGHAAVRWDRNSRILPGAICENLTSFGGILRSNASQTPMTEFTKHGAAGTSGTVIEPYAIISKFPHPIIHLHYRRGCSLAEAFFASVTSPYQLLIVGDPLCRPFANVPTVSVTDLDENEQKTISHGGKNKRETTLPVVSGMVVLNPTIESRPRPKEYQLFVDGILRQTIKPGTPLQFESKGMADGVHEVRIVARLKDSVETQGRWVRSLWVNNNDSEITAELKSPAQLTADQRLNINVQSKGARGVLFYQHNNRLGQTRRSRDRISMTAGTLGYGPVSLQLVASGNSPLNNVFALPVSTEVFPGPLLRARPASVATQLANGVSLTRMNGRRQSVASTVKPDWLSKAGVRPGERIDINGTLTVNRTALHLLKVDSSGPFEVAFDGLPLNPARARIKTPGREFPLLVEKGIHRVRVSTQVGADLQLAISFGDEGTQPLQGPFCKHVP